MAARWRWLLMTAAGVSIALAICTGFQAVGIDVPVLPRLDDLDVEQPSTADDAPAMRLPATMTVCIDRGAGRCWTEAGESHCDGGAVFGSGTTGVDDPRLPEIFDRCWLSVRRNLPNSDRDNRQD